MENKEAIFNFIKNSSNLWVKGIHGLTHFERVEKIGEFLAAANGADLEVVRLFAYTHDLGRIADSGDIEHGHRSAKIIEDLYNKGVLKLTAKQYQQLVYACDNHVTLLAHSDDITIRTCWDSDRLDLWRAGITPDPQYLYTELAKKPETIAWSKSLSLK